MGYFLLCKILAFEMNPADLLSNTCKLLCFNKVTDRSHTRLASDSGNDTGQEHYATMPFKRKEPISSNLAWQQM